MTDDDEFQDAPSPFLTPGQKFVQSIRDLALWPWWQLRNAWEAVTERFSGTTSTEVVDDDASSLDPPPGWMSQVIGFAKQPFVMAADWLAKSAIQSEPDANTHFEEEPKATALVRAAKAPLRLITLIVLPFVGLYFALRTLAARLLDPDRFHRQLLFGLPAVALVTAIVAVYFVGGLETEEAIKKRYFLEANVAFRNGDYQRAKLAYRRMLQFEPENQDCLYNLALSAQRLGQKDYAAALMDRLAPANGGFGPAHVWRARELLEKSPQTPQLQSAAEAHLVRALRSPKSAADARLLLAILYAQTNRPGLAEPMLKELAPNSADAQFELAKILAARGEKQAADIGFRKVVAELQWMLEKNPDDVSVRLKLVQAAALTGDMTRAELLLQQGMVLVPNGQFPIHLARLYLGWSDGLTATEPASASFRMELLARAARLLEGIAKENIHARQMLGIVYARMGKMNLAEPLLVEAARESPSIYLDLAQHFAEVGHRTSAHKYADLATKNFAHLADDPAAPENVALLLANAQLIKGNYPAAEAILRKRLPPLGSELTIKALARVYLIWHDDAHSNVDKHRGDRIRLLADVLEVDPWNVEALARLLSATRCSDVQLVAKARELLLQMLGQGQAPAAVHLLLGNDAYARGDLPAAKAHLRQAYELDPKMIEIANNLAWVLAFNPNPDLQGALSIISDALSRRPDHLELTETRGQILAKLGRWNEAIIDLEKCLAFKQGNVQFHRTMSEAYERLGMKDLASKQRQLLEYAIRHAAPKNP